MLFDPHSFAVTDFFDSDALCSSPTLFFLMWIDD